MSDEDVHELHGKLQNLGIRMSTKTLEEQSECQTMSSSQSNWGKPMANFKDKSPSESPETVEDELDTDESTSMLLHYTEETLGLAEDKLEISSLPYNVETYFLGSIRLVSIQKDYVPDIPELFHSNIVAQYGLLVSKNNDYFLMLESIIGTSVKEHLEEKTSTEEMKVLWVRDVSKGLYYLHSLNFWYGELSLDRMYIHESTLKLEHPAVCKKYGQGVEQDLREVCKLIKKISTDETLKRLSERIESRTIKTAGEVCQYLEEIIPRNTNLPRSDFGGQDVPEVVPMEVNYMEVVSPYRHALSNEPLPMCEIMESDLGEVESLERDETDTELERISSGALGCVFLRVRLDGSTKALLSGHFLYEALRRTKPNVAQMMELARLIKTADRIPDICFDIIAHPFVLQPRFMLGPSLHLNEVTDILYENAPLGTLYKHVERENTHFDDTTILEFACQLATAIEYCHLKLKIMHRDINSKSIFVFQAPTGRFYLKLGGFVFARRVPRGVAYGANTNRILRFSAPETLQSNSDVAFYSYSSDIWSYGMVLDYIAHDGRNPFDKLNHRSRLRKALWEDNIRPVLRADLHCDLVRLIKACYRSEKRGDDGVILDLSLRPTADQIRSFLVDHGHQNEEDGLALLAVAQQSRQ